MIQCNTIDRLRLVRHFRRKSEDINWQNVDTYFRYDHFRYSSIQSSPFSRQQMLIIFSRYILPFFFLIMKLFSYIYSHEVMWCKCHFLLFREIKRERRLCKSSIIITSLQKKSSICGIYQLSTSESGNIYFCLMRNWASVALWFLWRNATNSDIYFEVASFEMISS